MAARETAEAEAAQDSLKQNIHTLLDAGFTESEVRRFVEQTLNEERPLHIEDQ